MGAYYYAAGQKVELQLAKDLVAVDQAAAKGAGLAAKISTASAAGVRVGAGVVVTPRSSLTEDIIEKLRKAGALQPVYRRDKAVVVVMPEVRVEFDTPKQRGQVKSLLSSNASELSITEDTSDRMVIQPVSGRGEDALSLANRIQEHTNPAAVSVRFVQFVPRPKRDAKS